MLIIQNGYECDYEMKLFYKLILYERDIYVYSNFDIRISYKRVYGDNL